MTKTTIKNQEIARQFLNDERYQKNLLFCISFDLFYIYEDGWYRQITPREFSELVWEFICDNYPEHNVKTSMVDDVVHQIKWAVYRKVQDMDSPYIAFSDRLFNMDTFQPEDFDRKKIATFRLPFAYENINMEIPRWKQFLESTLVIKGTTDPDEDVINLVQEMFGYYLLNNLKAQKVFFMVGTGSNGKSVMINLLENMIGYDFISAMSLQFLTTDQFATSNLIGKKINICNEEESKYLRSDKFKALISGDLIDAGRKFEGRLAFRPRTKYLFASNVLPTFDGFNYGMKRRIIIIPFNRTFTEEERDVDMAEKLRAELPGVVAWAIEGAKRLVDNNYVFTKTEATEEMAVELQNFISSAIMFFRESYVKVESKDSKYFISNEKLYKEYVDWCDKHGKKKMSSHVFLKDIRNNLDVPEMVGTENGQLKRGMHVRQYSLEEELSLDQAVLEARDALNTLKNM